MATTTAPVSAPSKPLNCQTWVLKVSIHCQGCKRKVAKVLRGLDGVYASAIDSQQQRVTVTGNIGVEVLIKKLKKTGRHAEIWHDKFSSGKKEGTRATNRNDQDESKSVQKHDDDDGGSNESVKFSGEGSNEEKENTDDSTASKNEGAGKKKNKKGQKGNANTNHSSGSATSGLAAAAADYSGRMNQAVSSTNLNPARQHSVPYPQGFCYVPSLGGTNTTLAYPNGSPVTNFYLAPVPSSLYENAFAHRAITPSGLDSLYIFSDENVNGCMIM